MNVRKKILSKYAAVYRELVFLGGVGPSWIKLAIDLRYRHLCSAEKVRRKAGKA